MIERHSLQQEIRIALLQSEKLIIFFLHTTDTGKAPFHFSGSFPARFYQVSIGQSQFSRYFIGTAISGQRLSKQSMLCYVVPPFCHNCTSYCNFRKKDISAVFFHFIPLENASEEEGRRETNAIDGAIWNLSKMRDCWSSERRVISRLQLTWNKEYHFILISWKPVVYQRVIFRKSTFFNVLTKSSAAAENFPFCTIGQCSMT